MNWWGKVVGSSIGLVAGPIGALIGGYLGHQIDDNTKPSYDEKKAKLLFYAYFFSSAAKIAKADGVISRQEIEKVESLIRRMELSQKMENFAKDIFRKSKLSNRSIDQEFKECAQLIEYNQSIAHSFMGGLFEIVTCERKKPSSIQIKYLLEGQKLFKMPKGTIKSWFAGGYSVSGSVANNEDLTPYFQVLGVSKNASLSEIKNAYRKKISALHPDKLENKQLPKELIVFAKDQVIQINLAFEKIKKAYLK